MSRGRTARRWAAAGLLIGTAVSLPSAGGTPVVFDSGPARTALVEVFSSEGCSSCPPAERWLTDLQNNPALWKSVVPVCFHVDYWDYLGWKDRLASADFTRRQQAYGRLWGAGTVYTPGFALNGREWRGWFDGAAALPRATGDAGRLRVTLLDGGRFRAEFRPADGASAWRVEAATLGMNIVIPVQAGENRGKTLRHDFAALGHVVLDLKKDGDAFVADGTLAASGTDAPQAAAFWVRRADDPTPVQAAGGVLPGRAL